MSTEDGEQLLLLIAAIPTPAIVERLHAGLPLTTESHDVYLAYASGYGCRLAGFLIAQKGGIDHLIALCPIATDLVVGSAMWRVEVGRQLAIACRVAISTGAARKSPEVIWLNTSITNEGIVPSWIYSLACVPITVDWNGELEHPCPFSPELFEAMAMQPQAPEWLRTWLNRHAPQDDNEGGKP